MQRQSYSTKCCTQTMSNMKNFIPEDKIVEIGDGGNGGMRFGVIGFSEVGNCLAVQWENDLVPEPLVQMYSNKSVIRLVDRPLNIGARIRHRGLEGSVYNSKKLITVRLLDQYHQRVHTDEKGHEHVTDVGYTDPSPTGLSNILPRLNESNLKPWLGYKIGDHILHQSWVGVIKNGKVSIKYRFENGGDMRFEVMKELKDLSKSGVYIGWRQRYLGQSVLNSGHWSRGFRAYNKIAYRNRAAIVAGYEVRSLEVVWIEKMRPGSKLSECGAGPSQPPPTILKGDKLFGNVFVFADCNRNEKFYPESLCKVRWYPDLNENFDTWRQGFVDEVMTDPGTARDAIQENGEENETDSLFKRAKSNIQFSHRDWVAVRVLFTQTIVDILFDDNSTQSIPSHRIQEVINPYPRNAILGLSFPDVAYELGDIVQDLVDFDHNHNTKYGFVLRAHPSRRTVDVSWVKLIGTGSNPRIYQEVTEVSQYDLQLLNRYQWIKHKSQIVLGKGIFEGMIVGQNVPEGRIIVQCAEGPIKTFFPHEMTFLQKKAEVNPTSGEIVIRTIQKPPDNIPNRIYCCENPFSVKIRRDESGYEKYREFSSMHVPDDHSFSSKPPQTSVTSSPENLTFFSNCVEKEIELLRNAVIGSASGGSQPWAVYIERVGTGTNRLDLLTINVIGTKGTLYEDVPFFLDIFLPFGFWDWKNNHGNSELRPQVILRMGRVVFPGWIQPAIDMTTAALDYPNECLSAWNASSHNGQNEGGVTGFLFNVVHFFSNNLLCAEPFLQQGAAGPPVTLGLGRRDIAENYNGNNNNAPIIPPMKTGNPFNFQEMIKSRDYNETATVAIMDYVHSMLCCPPSSWKGFVECHFCEGLPRICRRILQTAKIGAEYEEEMPLNKSGEEFDIFYLNEVLGSKYLIHPLSASFHLAMENRIKLMHPFLEAALRQ